MSQSRPLFVYFRHFLDTISKIQIDKKLKWCAWDSNPGPQDGRLRRNHGAMAVMKFEVKAGAISSIAKITSVVIFDI